MSIMMGLQLLLYLYILYEHYCKNYGVELYDTTTNKQENDSIMFQ